MSRSKSTASLGIRMARIAIIQERDAVHGLEMEVSLIGLAVHLSW